MIYKLLRRFSRPLVRAIFDSLVEDDGMWQVTGKSEVAHAGGKFVVIRVGSRVEILNYRGQLVMPPLSFIENFLLGTALGWRCELQHFNGVSA